jgi:hypothetical protein
MILFRLQIGEDQDPSTAVTVDGVQRVKIGKGEELCIVERYQDLMRRYHSTSIVLLAVVLYLPYRNYLRFLKSRSGLGCARNYLLPHTPPRLASHMARSTLAIGSTDERHTTAARSTGPIT